MPGSSLVDSLLSLLQQLIGLGKPEGSQPSGNDEPPTPVTRKVSLIIFDPLIAEEGNRRLTQVLGWNEPDRLIDDYIADLHEVSHGYANYEIAERILVNDFPAKEDGFVYTGASFLRCWRQGSGFHQPDAVDYKRLVNDFRMIEKVADGSIDEFWTVSFPYAGFYESRMAGPGAFWCNAPPLETCHAAGRRFVIMAFNYERGVGEMLESYGHRAESILEQVYQRTLPSNNLWKRFIRYHKTHPGGAEVGTVHYAPNSRQDYDWGNPTPVETRCRTWKNFPDLSGPAQVLDCREWGSGNIRLHHKWWFDLLPHRSGTFYGIANNWWEYIVDPDRVQS